MRITVVISNNRGGGSTWSAVCWANAWCARGEQVSLVTMLPNEGDGGYFAVDERIDIQRIDLSDKPVANKAGAIFQMARNAWRLRRAIRRTKPEVVVAFDGPINVRTLVASMLMRTPVVVMEQVHPEQYSMGLFWEWCRKKLYPRADMVVNLTQTASEWCGRNFDLGRLAVIPNPVVVGRVQNVKRSDQRMVIAAGRLVEQKGFDLLIPAFADIAEDCPDWNLVIYGEGHLRGMLEDLVRKRGMEERISLPGWSDNLSSRMAEADFFVLSSRYEGFGNVVAEAMAVGLPVVAFDCPSGPSDIVRHEVDGLLVPHMNTAKLSKAMLRMAADHAFRETLASRTAEVLDRFSMKQTLEKWDRVFSQIRNI